MPFTLGNKHGKGGKRPGAGGKTREERATLEAIKREIWFQVHIERVNERPESILDRV